MDLHAGIDVFQDEVVQSSENSAARVIFQDKTTLEIAPSSEITLDEFVFDPNPAKSKVAVSIVSGVVRFTTGNLPKDNYKIYTPGGSLSVRGTVVSIHVDALGGSFVSVEEGSVIFSSGGQSVTINAGQSSFSSIGGTPSPPTNTPFPSYLLTQMIALLQQTTVTGGPPASVPPTTPSNNAPVIIDNNTSPAVSGAHNNSLAAVTERGTRAGHQRCGSARKATEAWIGGVSTRRRRADAGEGPSVISKSHVFKTVRRHRCAGPSFPRAADRARRPYCSTTGSGRHEVTRLERRRGNISLVWLRHGSVTQVKPKYALTAGTAANAAAANFSRAGLGGLLRSFS